MNPNYLTRADLAEFGRNTAAQVANSKVTGLLAAQVASISAAIANAADDLAVADREQVALRAASIAATEVARQKRLRLLKLIQDLKYTMKGLESQAHEFDALGFDPPVLTRSPVTPQTPVRLAATGFSNGVNILRFTGNNSPGRVTYVIEAKMADSPGYSIIGMSKSQRFKHTGFIPGVPVQYRVYAQAARGTVSASSNEAVIYRE